MADTDRGSSSLTWPDYLEVAILALACLIGLLGNMAVLRASLRIRTFSRQISLFFSGILCADVLVCGTRIPTTIYLLFSPASQEPRLEGTVATSSPTALTSDHNSGHAGMSGHKVMDGEKEGGEGGGGMEEHGGGGDGGMNVSVACEVWAANSALMMTIIWLHLAVALQRIAIIFSFSVYRRVFTPTGTGIMVLAAWGLGLILVYTPLRAVGMPMIPAGRGACRADDTTAEDLLIARSVLAALLCLLPLLVAGLCYVIVMRSVWLAREVRTESVSEYNRVVLVTFLRLLSLALTYVPVCLVLMAEVRSGLIPDAAHRYVGHFLWLQSVLSPFVTLQDNDFRDKMMVPNKHAPGMQKNGVGGEGGHVGGGDEGEVGVMPDIGSSGGQDGDEHRARNLQEMNREMRRSQLKRGLSFITSADMRTIRGSSD